MWRRLSQGYVITSVSRAYELGRPLVFGTYLRRSCSVWTHSATNASSATSASGYRPRSRMLRSGRCWLPTNITEGKRTPTSEGSTASRQAQAQCVTNLRSALCALLCRAVAPRTSLFRLSPSTLPHTLSRRLTYGFMQLQSRSRRCESPLGQRRALPRVTASFRGRGYSVTLTGVRGSE